MFEEPYRWIEAIENRRAYLEDQFKQASPVVALTYRQGVLLLTLSGGAPKIYEIYDRIAMGGMGHPADLEKLRASILEMAHLEGFNRSPSDVTVSRLMKFGLAPPVKQAFEEIFRAPFVAKLLLVQLGPHRGKNPIMTLDYDGVFEELTEDAALGATKEISQRMSGYLRERKGKDSLTLGKALRTGLLTWAVGLWTQQTPDQEKSNPKPEQGNAFPPEEVLTDLLKNELKNKQIEAALLEENLPGSSKFHTLSPQEWDTHIGGWLPVFSKGHD